MNYKILKYDEFVNEVLSINIDVKLLSETIFKNLKDKSIGVYIIHDDIPESFNAYEIIISIIKEDNEDNEDGIKGFFNVTKSKLKNGKWSLYLDIAEKSDISIYYHELNHAFQFIKDGKYNTIKDINKTDSFYKSNDYFKNIFTIFYEMIYLSSDSEINSNIAETYSIIKKIFNRNFNSSSINNNNFIFILKQTDSWKISLKLIDFKISDYNYDKQLLNKFLCYAEWSKTNLDKVGTDNKSKASNRLPSYLKNIWYSFKVFKYDGSQKPKHNIQYYEKYINSQGIKLQHKLIKLYGHFNMDSGITLKDTKI